MQAHAAGVDVGSTQTKAVIVNEAGALVGRSLIDTGAHVGAAAERAFLLALEQAGLAEEQVLRVVGTGYGRYRVTFGDAQVTEIGCHARGAAHLFPATRLVVDMGGQDTKAISIGPGGEVKDFCMNDKCAAGTGRFLQSAAAALDIPLPELGTIALRGTKPVKISTTCTVFAESEVLAWLSKGKKIEDILFGVHHSIASRSLGLMRRVGIEREVTFTGGVSRNPAMRAMLEADLGFPLNTSEESHFCGALGAALFALDHVLASRQPHAAPAAPAAAGGRP